MKNQIQIAGAYQFNNKTGLFTGSVNFEERDSSIYYSWNIHDEDGNRLAGKSMPVAFQQIPMGADKFEFSKAHAVEGITKFRIGRERIILELNIK